jgi:hypothetical protein
MSLKLFGRFVDFGAELAGMGMVCELMLLESFK